MRTVSSKNPAQNFRRIEMKKTRILALVLIVCMLATVFVACTKKETDDGKDNTPSSKPSTSIDGNENPDDGGEVEIEEINFWMHAPNYYEDLQDIEDALNELTERDIGIHVNITAIPSGDYGAQLSLAIANNESIDACTVVPMPAGSFTTLYSNGALYDITDLLEEYGQGIKALLGDEILAAQQVDGRQYGLSNYRLLASAPYIVYRTDSLENAGVLEDFRNMQTWAEFEAVMTAVMDSNSTYGFGIQGNVSYNFVLGAESIYDTYAYDYLGDSLLLVFAKQNGEVGLVYDQEDVLNQYRMYADWMKKGILYPDSPINTESSDILVSQNAYAGQVTQSEFGIEIAKKQSMGIDVECVQLGDGLISTSTCRIWSMGMPASSANPVGGMKFLNYLYTTAEAMNLLIWGIEGQNYYVKDTGEAAYLEGKDASTSGYHFGDYAMGNQFLVLPWEGQGGDFRVRAEENLKNSTRSIFLGLSFDTSDYSTMITALSAVKAEYMGQVCYGQFSDKLLDEYLQKLGTAGIDDYIALYQAAAADFLA